MPYLKGENMKNNELPDWAKTLIEKYFGYDKIAKPDSMYWVVQFWYANVMNTNATLIETVFAVVKKNSGDSLYFLRITAGQIEVSNIMY